MFRLFGKSGLPALGKNIYNITSFQQPLSVPQTGRTRAIYPINSSDTISAIRARDSNISSFSPYTSTMPLHTRRITQPFIQEIGRKNTPFNSRTYSSDTGKKYRGQWSPSIGHGIQEHNPVFNTNSNHPVRSLHPSKVLSHNLHSYTNPSNNIDFYTSGKYSFMNPVIHQQQESVEHKNSLPHRVSHEQTASGGYKGYLSALTEYSVGVTNMNAISYSSGMRYSDRSMYKPREQREHTSRVRYHKPAHIEGYRSSREEERSSRQNRYTSREHQHTSGAYQYRTRNQDDVPRERQQTRRERLSYTVPSPINMYHDNESSLHTHSTKHPVTMHNKRDTPLTGSWNRRRVGEMESQEERNCNNRIRQFISTHSFERSIPLYNQEAVRHAFVEYIARMVEFVSPHNEVAKQLLTYMASYRQYGSIQNHKNIYVITNRAVKEITQRNGGHGWYAIKNQMRGLESLVHLVYTMTYALNACNPNVLYTANRNTYSPSLEEALQNCVSSGLYEADRETQCMEHSEKEIVLSHSYFCYLFKQLYNIKNNA